MPGAESKLVKLVRCPVDADLPQDRAQLAALFETVLILWGKWPGPKPKHRALARINAAARQVTHGDCPEQQHVQPESSFEQTVCEFWAAYKGMSAEMAMRRFLILIRRVEPSLLQAKHCTHVPFGFPCNAAGEQICPYANSARGCIHPLIDSFGRSLEHELDTNDDLADFTQLQVRH